MDVKLHNCFVIVDDHEKAIAFYRDVLGFEVRTDVSYGGMRWVSVGSPAQPDVHILLEPPAADPGISPSDRAAISDLLAKGLLGGVNLSTLDLESLRELRPDRLGALPAPIDACSSGTSGSTASLQILSSDTGLPPREVLRRVHLCAGTLLVAAELGRSCGAGFVPADGLLSVLAGG